MNLKKYYGNTKLSDGKTIGGQGRLTAGLMNELSDYFGIAVRSNSSSAKEMKKAVLATWYHKASTDKKPQHQYCPKGEECWCKYQKAKATKQKTKYKHEKILPPAILQAIYPIYLDLSKPDLLERCVGGFTQNNNESLHSTIWIQAPKVLFSGTDTVIVAVNIAVSIFNDGFISVLRTMEALNVKPGTNAEQMCRAVDQERLEKVEREKAEEEQKLAEGAVYSAGSF